MIHSELPYPLIHLPSVDSTNIYAGRLLQQQDVSEGTVILADFQSNGKGQGGSVWNSEAGKNLLFSLILKPRMLPAEKQFYLSMCISNALADFVSKEAGEAHIKWPNDILVKRRKIAGILIENTIMGENLYTSIVGIGLNVNQTDFPADIPFPVSLKMINGREYEMIKLLNEMLKNISGQLDTLGTGRLDIIRTAYLNRLLLLNQWAIFEDMNSTFEGRIIDVEDTGELLILRRNGEMTRYGFKEVSFQIN